MFGAFGELREVHIIRGPDGGPKGCAFVKFVDKYAAMAAIQHLNNMIPQVGGNCAFCVLVNCRHHSQFFVCMVWFPQKFSLSF